MKCRDELDHKYLMHITNAKACLRLPNGTRQARKTQLKADALSTRKEAVLDWTLKYR